MMLSNLLLSSLSTGDLAALQPHLKEVHLEQKTVLHEMGDLTKAVYFPTTAVISLVVTLSSGEMTEAAMIGRDGAVGLAAALDSNIAFSRAVVQLGGKAMICDQNAFRGAALQSEALIAKIMRHEQALFAQAQQSNACMANHDVEARLCRWLLRARDLAGSDKLPFTQEFLGDMLGVRRTSVTSVARTLQEAAMIRYSRGKIEILDVDGLQEASCECYQTVRDQYERLRTERFRG